MKFKVGDKVQWAGIKGKVVGQSQLSPRCEVMLEVEFEAKSYGTRNATSYFFEDGRHLHWHKEPSLKMRVSD